MQYVKVVVSGAFNAGKTQFIKTISDIPVVSTERRVTDSTKTIKSSTTTAMDFGRYTIKDLKVGIYGTPGQRRFDFMWHVLSKGMHGFIIFVDSTDFDTFTEASYIIGVFTGMHPHTPYIVAANKQDRPGAYSLQEIRAALDLPAAIPLVPCVAIERARVEYVMRVLLYMIFRTKLQTQSISIHTPQEAAPSILRFDPANPVFRANPYPFYEHLHTSEPVHRTASGCWLISRYADAMEILHSPHFKHRESRTAEYTQHLIDKGQLSPLEIVSSYWMISKNPPDHTRLRQSLGHAFNSKAISNLHDRIQEKVDTLLDLVYEQGQMDVIEDFAYPLPVAIISDLLGIPEDVRNQLRVWALDLLDIVDIVAPSKKISQGNQAIQGFSKYFHSVIMERQNNPGQDLISQIILNNRKENLHLSINEMVANCILIFVAGHQTSMNLIGNGVLALLQNPKQLMKLRENPDLISTAIEELLRYTSPVQVIDRTPSKDIVIGGKQIRRNQIMYLLLGAINRDPAQFFQPNQLDITRTNNRHLAFGYGIHFCLGAPLARVEGRIAIGTLIQRLCNLRLQPNVALAWRENFAVRGLKSLPVRFD